MGEEPNQAAKESLQLIRLQTFSELAARNHTLGLYCVNCDRWQVADLAGLIQAGRGSAVITQARFRCHDCGELAEKQLRPPVPTLGGSVGYV